MSLPATVPLAPPHSHALHDDYITQYDPPDTYLAPYVPVNPVSSVPAPVCVAPCLAAYLFSAIASLSDKLFFVAYYSPLVMRKRWYLVQVGLFASAHDLGSQSYETGVLYYVDFLAKVSHDLNLLDSAAQWWLDWCAFSTSPSGYLTLESCHAEFWSTCTTNLKLYTHLASP